MQVNAISRGFLAPRQRVGTAGVGAAGIPAVSRAVVAVEPPASSSELPRPINRRPQAAFLVHLLATAGQVPQTRARRRVTPAEAIRSYEAALAVRSPPSGQVLSQAT